MLLRQDRAMLAVTVMLEVGFYGSRSVTVSAADLAERLGLARRGMEPLLQALSRAGLLDSARGPRGGYRLGRSARDIRLIDILAAAQEEAETADLPAGALTGAVVAPLWAEMEAALAERFGALTLDGLLRRATDAGLVRPAPEPISFAI